MKEGSPQSLSLAYSKKEQNVYAFLENLVLNKPFLFDPLLFKEFKKVTARAEPLFFEYRSQKHIVRLIAYLGYLRWKLANKIVLTPYQRHLIIRLLPTELSLPFGNQKVLGILIGFAKFNVNERLEEKHISSAINKVISGVEVISDSFYHDDNNKNSSLISYLEIQKTSGKEFSNKEKAQLKTELPGVLIKHIEKLIPAVFKVRNEEEIGRTLFLLNEEIVFEDDLPQVSISFEKQTETHLVFTVIALYLQTKSDTLVTHKIELIDPHAKIQVEREILAGYLKNGLRKKGVVFSLTYQITSEVLRSDFSINLPKAREKVVTNLHALFGEFRDYNGGLFFKQNQLLYDLKRKIPLNDTSDLIENFFYNIFPIENQAVMDLEEAFAFLQVVIDVNHQALDAKKNAIFESKKINNKMCIVIKSFQKDLHDLIFDKMNQKPNEFKDVIFSKFRNEPHYITGIFINYCNKKENLLLNSIKETISFWQKKNQSFQSLNLSIASSPISLDPRRGGEEISSTVLRFLFEGLMKVGEGGKLEKGVASNVIVSEDQKTYWFELKKTFWSDGKLLTAHDFEYSWRKVLSPGFFAPFCYLFYPIKNAKKIKSGELSSTELGVKALNDLMLEVKLEKPISYFLDLVGHNLYSPISKSHDQSCPNWETLEKEKFICNGPFKVEQQSDGFYLFERNPHYLNSRAIHLEKIFISKFNNPSALKAFQKKEIDWLGAPLHPWEVMFQIKNNKTVTKDSNSSEVLWTVCNTSDPILKSVPLRKALAYAINRRKILSDLGYDGCVAHSILPSIYAMRVEDKLEKGNPILAREYYKQALDEIGAPIPKFTLFTSHGGIREKIAQEVRRQWEENLGFQCRIQKIEWLELFQLMVFGEFQLATVMWKPIVNDAMYTLEVFHSKNHPVNFSNWESEKFQEILTSKRDINTKRLLAEEILLDEFPVIPLICEEQYYMKADNLSGFYSYMGQIDFSRAYFSKPNSN